MMKPNDAQAAVELAQGGARGKERRGAGAALALLMVMRGAVGCAQEGGAAPGVQMHSSALSQAASDADAGASDAGSACIHCSTLADGAFRALAISGAHLYLVGDTIERISTQGGPLEPISSAASASLFRISADDQYLFGAISPRPYHTEIWRMPISGGNFSAEEGGVLLGEVSNIVAFEALERHVITYEATPGHYNWQRHITRFDKAGLVAAETVAVVDEWLNAFAVDEQDAYYIAGLESAQQIMALPLAGGEPRALAGVESSSEVFKDMTVLGEDLLFVSSTRLGKVPVMGGEVVTLSPVAQVWYRVLADSQYAYVLEGKANVFVGGVACADGSQLYRLAINGGGPEYLASEPEPGCIKQITQDADALYWLSGSGQHLRKVGKR